MTNIIAVKCNELKQIGLILWSDSDNESILSARRVHNSQCI